MIAVSIWEFTTALSKLWVYIGLAICLGGYLILQLSKNHHHFSALNYRYCLIGALVSCISIAVHFFIQVGAFAESGFAGMFDTNMIAILWQSNIGDSIQLRLVGIALILLCLYVSAQTSIERIYQWMLFGVAAAMIGRSFSIIGHTVDQPLLIQLLLSIHIICISGWVGALWPLKQACTALTLPALYLLMIRFSQFAVIAVGVLIISGFIVSIQLLGSIGELFHAIVHTAYGQLLGIKLLFVSLLLALATYHKWRLVPALLDTVSSGNHASKAKPQKALQRSINREIYIAVATLLITAWLTTALGPAHN